MSDEPQGASGAPPEFQVFLSGHLVKALRACADALAPATHRESMMNITSIDNCYEDDGLVLLQGALNALNHQLDAEPKRRLVAILPEYSADGTRLDRLNVCTVPADDPGAVTVTDTDVALMQAAEAVVKDLQAARANAYAKANSVPRVE